MKRIFDLTVACIALAIFSPLMIIIALIVRCTLGSPVFFTQQRPGKLGQPFTLIKFRTMKRTSDHSGVPLPDDLRMTAIGSFLRSSSLDELPELWNVIKGEMSLVGPRPLLMEYIPLYDSQQARRHEVRPGLTGWAQINGRNAISWPQKFALDVWYVDHRTFALDLRILMLTIIKVFRRDGITDAHSATTEKFGSKQQ